MTRKHPPLREICQRITVEFAPLHAELIRRERVRRIKAGEPSSYSEILRTLVREHLK